MQVNLNLTPSKMTFKACKNNGCININPKFQNTPFMANLHSVKQEGYFEKIISKIKSSKKEESKTLIQVFEINPAKTLEANGVQGSMIEHYMQEFCVDPLEVLFITSYKDKNGHPIVVFNSFSVAPDDSEKMQLFVLESSTNELTKAQKAAYKMFYDDNTRNLLSKGSRNNPLKEVESSDLSKDIAVKMSRISRNIQNLNWAKYCANADYIDSVVFSADGSKKYWFNQTNK